MKGEAFLLAALIISVSLVAMFQPVRREYLVKQKEILESEYFEKIFENVLNEIKNSVYFSFNDFDKMILNAFDFANFSEEKIKSKAMSFGSLIILAKANSSGYLNVTTINFLKDNLALNLTFNDTQNSILILPLYSISSTNFTFVAGNSYNLTVSYDINKTITIETSNKDVFVSYVDLIITFGSYSKRETNIFSMS
ncbi:MAG: hypothetical protein ACP5JK_02525 [Candidatus Aenigmatarchaeota archaeon]